MATAAALPTTAPIPRDVIHGFTRFVAALLGVVVLYAAVVLTLFPAQAPLLFAWNIQPPMNAAFMGAAYANGVVFFAAVLGGRVWHRVAAPHVGVFVFSALLITATFLHWDRFNHGHPVFWAWVFIYLAAPVLVPIAVWRNRAEDPRTPEARDAVVPAAARVLWALGGAVILAISLVAFADPARVIALWPWKLTPLTARVVTGFYAILGAAPLSVVFERRWSAWRTGAIGMMVWHALLLVAALRRAQDFTAPPASTLWFRAEVVVLVATALTFVVMEARRRTPASR
jgi:hypothetical protein